MTSALTIKDNQMQKKWYTIYNILHIKMTLAHAWAPTGGGKKGHLPPPPPPPLEIQKYEGPHKDNLTRKIFFLNI